MNSFEIRRQILNFSNQVLTQSKSQYLPYNKKKLFLHSRKFLAFASAFWRCHNVTYLYKKACITEKHHVSQKPLTLQESLAFRNRHLNGAPSISDIKRLCLNQLIFTCLLVTACGVINLESEKHTPNLLISFQRDFHQDHT